MNSLNSGLNYGRPDDLIIDFNKYIPNLADGTYTYGTYVIPLKNPIILANCFEDAYISLDKIAGFLRIIGNVQQTTFTVSCDQAYSYNSNADKIIYHSIINGANIAPDLANIVETPNRYPRFYKLQRTENNIIDSVTLRLVIDNATLTIAGAKRLWGRIRLCKGGNKRPYSKNLKRIKNGY